MGLDTHPSINTISDDTQIWRYYTTSKFLSLLEDESLYLSRIDQFEDPFEGYAPVQNLKKDQRSRQQLKDNLDELHSQTDSGEYPETKTSGEKVAAAYETLRTQTLASCWSIGREDKLEMWKAYIPDGDGVAISTTFGDLRSAIEKGDDFDYYAGKVQYLEYFSDFFGSTKYFDHIASKPSQYSFEKEMRLLMWWPEHGNGGPAPNGQQFKLDLDELINHLYLSPFAPAWTSKDTWNNVLSDMGVDTEVKTSNLAMEPQDYLS